MSILLSEGVDADEARRQTWLEKRKQYVTSTDVPVLFGQGYSGSSPAALYAQKKGFAPDFEASLRMKIGRLMEPVIDQVYLEVRGKKVTPAAPYLLHVSEDHPFLAASLDGQDEDGVLIERKNHGDFLRDITDVPAGWYLQCQTQMLVMKRDLVRLVVLTRGCDIAIFDIVANPEVQAEIVTRAHAFHSALLDGVVPAPSVPEDNAAYKWIFQASDGVVADLDFDFGMVGTARDGINRQIKELEAERDLMEAKVKFAMGNATEGVVQDTGDLWTWRQDKNGRRSLRFRKGSKA